MEKSCGTSGHVEPAVLCLGGGSVGRKTAEISGFERNNITSVAQMARDDAGRTVMRESLIPEN